MELKLLPSKSVQHIRWPQETRLDSMRHWSSGLEASGLESEPILRVHDLEEDFLAAASTGSDPKGKGDATKLLSTASWGIAALCSKRRW